MAAYEFEKPSPDEVRARVKEVVKNRPLQFSASPDVIGLGVSIEDLEREREKAQVDEAKSTNGLRWLLKGLISLLIGR